MSLTTDQKIALTGIATNFLVQSGLATSPERLEKELNNVYLVLEKFVTSEEPVEPKPVETYSGSSEPLKL